MCDGRDDLCTENVDEQGCDLTTPLAASMATFLLTHIAIIVIYDFCRGDSGKLGDRATSQPSISSGASLDRNEFLRTFTFGRHFLNSDRAAEIASSFYSAELERLQTSTFFGCSEAPT